MSELRSAVSSTALGNHALSCGSLYDEREERRPATSCDRVNTEVKDAKMAGEDGRSHFCTAQQKNIEKIYFLNYFGDIFLDWATNYYRVTMYYYELGL